MTTTGVSRSRVHPALPTAAALFLLVLVLHTGRAHAASEEIQVYLDDLTKPGRFGADIHNNVTLSGSRTPDYPGALPAHHLLRVTPELYYGVSKTFELGLYLLNTYSPGNGANYEGQKVRFKYIAPHNEGEGSFWGLNLEIGRTAKRVAEVPWNTELKGIYGFRTGPWTVGINANFEWSLAGSPATPVALEMSTKVAYDVRQGLAVGFESYNDIGPVRDPGRLGSQSQMLYGVVDAEVGKVDLNIGLGRGLTSVSDRWVLKVIVGLQY
jgi:hypothetical protein